MWRQPAIWSACRVPLERSTAAVAGWSGPFFSLYPRLITGRLRTRIVRSLRHGPALTSSQVLDAADRIVQYALAGGIGTRAGAVGKREPILMGLVAECLYLCVGAIRADAHRGNRRRLI